MHGVIGFAPAATISKLYKTLIFKETSLLSAGNVPSAGYIPTNDTLADRGGPCAST